jgi:hypothetical protein
MSILISVQVIPPECINPSKIRCHIAISPMHSAVIYFIDYVEQYLTHFTVHHSNTTSSAAQSKQAMVTPAAVHSTSTPHTSTPTIRVPPAQSSESIDLTDPAPLTAFIPLESQPKPECRHEHDVGVVFTAVELLEGGFWNGWPSGRFALDFDHAAYMKHGMLAVQWAARNCKGNNGRKNQQGSVHSAKISGGKESYKKCLGVFRCTNIHGQIITRPKVDRKAFETQRLHGQCQCRAALEHFECGSMSYLIEYGQVGDDIATRKYRFINGVSHNHPRLPYVVHMTAQESSDSREHIGNHLDKTPMAIYQGGRNADGPTPAAPDLAQSAENPDNWRYHFRKIKKGINAENGSSFINKFHSWIVNCTGTPRVLLS